MLVKSITIALFAGLAVGNPVEVRAYSYPKPKGKQAAPDTTVSGTCTTTIPVKPDYTQGPTETIWTLTMTATHLVDCGTCNALTTTHLPFGPGPAVFFTDTVIATTPTTTTVMQCKPTSNMKIESVMTPKTAKKFKVKQTKAQAKARAKAAYDARKAKAKSKAKHN